MKRALVALVITTLAASVGVGVSGTPAGVAQAEYRLVASAGEVVGEHAFAARFADRAGETDRAARLWLEAGEPALAAPAFAEVGDHEAAIDAWLDAGETSLAGDHAEDHVPSRAVEIWLDAGEPLRAADLLLELGDETRAAELYAEAGDALAAQVVYERVGDLASAAEMADARGDRVSALTDAARLYDELGDPATAEARRTRALELAKEQDAGPTAVLGLYGELGWYNGGVDWGLTELEERLAAGDVPGTIEAYEALWAHMESGEKLHRLYPRHRGWIAYGRLRDRMDVAFPEAELAYAAWPRVTQLDGVNHFLEINGYDHFEYTEVAATVVNSTNDVADLVVVVRLYEKDLSFFAGGRSDRDGFQTFEEADAGHVEEFVLENVFPDQAVRLDERLDNHVPYRWVTVGVDRVQ